MSDRCPHAWHGGLGLGLLIECKYKKKHSGSHRSEGGDLSWTGKLSDAEMARANELRAARA